jgi:hypothetical protein
MKQSLANCEQHNYTLLQGQYQGISMFRRVFRTTFVASLVFLFSANVQAQSGDSINLAPGFTAVPAQSKVVLMPVDVELFSMSAGGILEPKADWTASAQKHMRVALQKRKSSAGLTMSELTESEADEFDDVSSLHAAVARSIALHHFGGIKLPTKNGKLDWSLGEGVKALHEKTKADYGLFIWVRDSYATAERKAMMVGLAIFGVGINLGSQVGYASLVDLRTGQVVWFNRLASISGDLRELEPAQQSIDYLLTGFPKVAR